MFPKALDRALTMLDRVVQFLCVFALGVVVVAVSWQVLSRYVTSASSPWTSELAAFAFVWLSMFAIALGVRRGRHMVLDIWEYFSYRRWLNNAIWVFSIGAVMLVLALLAYYGFAGLSASFARKMPALGISNGWMNLAVPVGCTLSLLFAAESLWKLLLAKQGEEPLPKGVLYSDEVEQDEELMVAAEERRIMERVHEEELHEEERSN